MRLEFTFIARNGLRHDLVVTGHPAATWAHALRDRVRDGDRVFVGDRRLDPGAALGSGAVRNGDVLSVGAPGAGITWPLTRPCVAVLAGAAAGLVTPLPTGRSVIGRQAPADLVIPDPTLSAQHAKLEVRDGRIRVSDHGSTNGTRRDGAAVTDRPIDLQVGDRLQLGQAVVTVLPARPADGSTEAGSEGERLFNRVLRYLEPRPPRRVNLPAEPHRSDQGSNAPQYLSSAVMIVAGGGAAWMSGNILYAVLGAAGPIVLMGTTAVMGRRAKREAARERAEVLRAREAAVAEIASAAREQLDHAWHETMDPATAYLAAVGPTSALWSSDPSDPRGLVVRLGTTDLPADVEVQGDEARSRVPVLSAAPVTINLRAHPVVGLAGPIAAVNGAARALVTQICATRSPADLAVCYLGSGSGPDEWSWLRWLPHVRTLVPHVHSVAPTAEALKHRLDELSALIEQREHAIRNAGSTPILLPEVVVLLDGAGALRSRSAVVKVLQEGPVHGIRIIALDAQSSRLPVEATARFVLEGTIGRLDVKGAASLADVTPDAVSIGTAEAAARSLSNLVPLGGRTDTSMPTSVRFLDLVGLTDLRESAVHAGWHSRAEGDAVLGVDEHGNALTVNIVRDGPHVLVAGSTGSGKSELLRTLIAGWALSASPRDLSLLLIDFKGGGAFGKLADLPHVVGYADDLTIGGTLAQRLLDSLRAELDYRKAAFKAAGNVGDLPEYRRARTATAPAHSTAAPPPLTHDTAGAGRPLPSIARLIIVVDEFAELKDAQPDFIDGLVNVARVGRSLGVHLVLATQQPAGVVTPQIRDNANLRICLRVLDSATSLELVRSRVAATFPHETKGRAVIAAGDSSAPTIVQTAYVSGSTTAALTTEAPPPVVVAMPWSGCGLGGATETRAEESGAAENDLSQLVALLRAAARGIPPARQPWRRPLGDVLSVSVLLRAVAEGPEIPFGVEDLPREQRQRVVALVLGGGNIGIAGGKASGRSTALRTLAYALAQRFGADDLHLYVIDNSPAPALRVLSRLPQCGVSATRNDRYVTQRLVRRLVELLGERSHLLASSGHSSYATLRAAMGPAAPPRVVLLVDGWDSIMADATSGVEVTRDAIVRLAEDGPSLGIQVVIAGGKAVAAPRVASTFQDLLCLRFEQRDDMAGFGVPVRGIPAELPAGRAYRPGSTDAIQLATIDGSISSDEQTAALVRFGDALPTPQRHRPIRVDDIPTRIGLLEAQVLPGAPTTPGSVILGVGGDTLSCRTVDVTGPAPVVLCGPPGAGRTEALVVVARQLAEQGMPIIVANVAGRDAHRFHGLPLADRSIPEGLDPRTVVLVDDAHAIDPMDSGLLSALQRESVRVVLSGDTSGLPGYAGWKARLRGNAVGVLLSPQQGEGEAFGGAVGRESAFSGPPGRALFSGRGRFELTQVPLSS